MCRWWLRCHCTIAASALCRVTSMTLVAHLVVQLWFSPSGADFDFSELHPTYHTGHRRCRTVPFFYPLPGRRNHERSNIIIDVGAGQVAIRRGASCRRRFFVLATWFSCGATRRSITSRRFTTFSGITTARLKRTWGQPSCVSSSWTTHKIGLIG